MTASPYAPSRVFSLLLDHTARALVFLADHAARRSSIPNPMAATRVVLTHIADQNLSGGDMYDEVTWALRKLGFTWPAGLCDNCNGPLDDDQAESTGLCGDCDTWICACAFENPGTEERCRGCHLTHNGQGEPMSPCTCGCDTAFGQFGDYDTESSVSRQHFIDTGRFLRPGETLDAG
ncbi:hypothetical protein OG883_43695 [Streptomyces sp. NBC_01142]|uniref:hypothetical protein n=1 Tax=Streptomyces sp. NBC_01142 TaxID=2975865 RepID=UPI002259556A|nr:hypothetical protein [Streptomyces sp. NBC_01142]MCX4826545.1 hypothetical protein [Streptomyces sp. NBC_01142]